MAQAPAAQFLDVRGVRMHVREAGSGPPLLLLHGAGGAGPWRPYQDMLAREFRLIVPDHPGWGLSDRPDWLESMDDLVYHYLDFLEALGLDSANVVGQSLGGWLAAELAVAHPEVVERMVLIDPAGLRHLGRPIPDLFTLSDAQTTRLVFHDQSAAEKEIVEEPGLDAIMQRIKNQTTFARLSWNPYLYNPKLARRLYRVKAPTLLIWGREDRVIPFENAELWMEAMPHARLAALDACGHVPHRERPDELARLVSDFLKEPA
jgi:pimeloyl-ACP methyl ester carboxylesterase